MVTESAVGFLFPSFFFVVEILQYGVQEAGVVLIISKEYFREILGQNNVRFFVAVIVVVYFLVVIQEYSICFSGKSPANLLTNCCGPRRISER